jgi:hypothetical protein
MFVRFCAHPKNWEVLEMNEDPIVAELRRRRQEHAAQYDNDLVAICRAIKEQEEKSSRKVVNRPAKRLMPKTGS